MQSGITEVPALAPYVLPRWLPKPVEAILFTTELALILYHFLKRISIGDLVRACADFLNRVKWAKGV